MWRLVRIRELEGRDHVCASCDESCSGHFDSYRLIFGFESLPRMGLASRNAPPC